MALRAVQSGVGRVRTQIRGLGQSGPTYLADFLLGTTSGVLPAGVSVSSPSLGGLVGDSAGKLTFKPNNLLTWSNTFSNAAWGPSGISFTSGAPDPLGGVNATTLTATTSSAYFRQSVSVTPGASYLTTVWLRRRSGSGAVNFEHINAGIGPAISLTSSWQQFTYLAAPSSASAYPGLVISTSGDAVDVYGMTFSAVTYETTPRAADQVITTSSAYYGPAWDRDSAGNALGLRIWESRTNYAQYSAQFDNAFWSTANGATVSPNVGTAPDGTVSADLLYPASTGANRLLFWNGGRQVTNTASVFVKAAGLSWIALGGNTATADVAFFNVSTGTKGTVGANITASSIIPAGNGWYRCIVTLAAGAGGGSPFAAFVVDADASLNVTASGTNGVWLWGGQVENASYAGPYIPTYDQSKYAAADVVTLTGTALATLQGAAASVVAEVAGTPTTYGQIIGLPSSVTLLGRNAGSTTQVYTQTATPATVVATLGTGTTASTFRAATSFDGTTSSVVAAGGTVVDASGAPPGRASAQVGGRSDGFYLNSYVTKLALYNTRLPDATLQAKSVVGAAF